MGNLGDKSIRWRLVPSTVGLVVALFVVVASASLVGVTSASAADAGSPLSTPTIHPSARVAHLTTATGYDMVAADGGVFVFGGKFFGSLPGLRVRVHDIVGIVASFDLNGYYLVGADGGVFSFGDTQFEGSLPGLGVRVNDIVGIVPTSDDRGYFLVGSDGGVFAFGDASFEGSLPGLGRRVNDVSAIASTPSNAGYWVVEKSGAVTSFGNAPNVTDGLPLVNFNDSPAYIDIASTDDGRGYWVLDSFGEVWAFGDALFLGDVPTVHGGTPVSLIPVPGVDNQGYWIIGSDGGVYAFAETPFFGSLPGLGVVPNLPVVGAAPT